MTFLDVHLCDNGVVAGRFVIYGRMIRREPISNLFAVVFMTHFRATIAIVMGLTVCGGMLVPGCHRKTSPEAISPSVQFRLLGRMYVGQFP